MQTFIDRKHPGNDTESGQHVGRGFEKSRCVSGGIGLFGQRFESMLGDEGVDHHGNDDADYEGAHTQHRERKRTGDRHRNDNQQAAGAAEGEEDAEGGGESAVNVLSSLMSVLVLPLLHFFGNDVHMQVLMVVMVMGVKVLVDFNLAAKESNEGGESGDDKEAAGTEVESTLPTLGEEFAAEVAEDAGDRDYDSVGSGETRGKPDHTTKIVLDGDAKGRDRCEMVWADPMKQSSGEDGEQKQHAIRLLAPTTVIGRIP